MSTAKLKVTPAATAPTAPTESPVQPTAVELTAPLGYMEHPYTGQRFYPGKATKVWSVDDWIQAQLDAEKLTYAAD